MVYLLEDGHQSQLQPGPTCVNFVHWRTPLTTTPHRIFYPHKLAFSTEILMFLLPTSITFRYLGHLVANRMSRVRTPVERDGVVGFKQFCTIFPHIFQPHIWCLCGRIFFKFRVKLTCLVNTHCAHTNSPILQVGRRIKGASEGMRYVASKVNKGRTESDEVTKYDTIRYEMLDSRHESA